MENQFGMLPRIFIETRPLHGTSCYVQEDSALVSFHVKGEEFLRLDVNDGGIYLRGKLVETDKEAVQGMCEFLKSQFLLR
jgi:hypothetical protein